MHAMCHILARDISYESPNQKVSFSEILNLRLGAQGQLFFQSVSVKSRRKPLDRARFHCYACFDNLWLVFGIAIGV